MSSKNARILLTFLRNLRENPLAIAVSAFAAFGGFLYGYDTGTISGILEMPCFLDTTGAVPSGEHQISSDGKALIVSTLSMGMFFGALLGFPSSEFLGHRWGVMLACLIFSIGVSCQTAATSIPLFVAGRVIAGLGVGIISSIIPMYQSECAPKWIRGAIVSAYQWFITIGLLIAAVLNNTTKSYPGQRCYQIPVAIQLVFALILALGMYFLPESPRYLILKGRIQEAHRSQARLISRDVKDPEVHEDVQELIDNTELMKVYGNGSYADCFKMGLQKNCARTLAGIFLQAWTQLTGINFIFYYGTNFFSSTDKDSAYNNIIIINVVNVIMTIPGMILMDRLGRRKILIIGAVGMLLCEYIVAIIGETIFGYDNPPKGITYASMVFICIYIAFYAATWGPAGWVIIGELYPISTRAKAVSLATASNWLFNFALGYATPYVVDKDHANLGSRVFFIWGSTCLGCLIFAIFCIWETKGLSLEQVNYLVRNSSPLRSSKLNEQLKEGIVVESDMDNAEPFLYRNQNSYGSN